MTTPDTPNSTTSPPTFRPSTGRAAPARVTPNLRLTERWAPPASPGSTATAPTRTRPSPVATIAVDPATPPALDPADPRWVLARRAAEQLDGSALSPDRRERLVRLGKVMGLTAFDAHLVLAVVQDQARRGVDPVYCPAAGAAQLAVIPGPSNAPRTRSSRRRRVWFLVAAALLAELALGAWLLLR